MTSNGIIVKTEADIDFVTNYLSEENSQNSQNMEKTLLSSLQQQEQIPIIAAAATVRTMNPNSTTQNTIEDDGSKLKHLLKEFNLEMLYNTLKLNDITYRSLRYLSVDDIYAAIRSIGYRAEFREKLFSWRRQKFGTNDTIVAPIQKVSAHRIPLANTNRPSPSSLTVVAAPLNSPQPVTTFLNSINNTPVTASNLIATTASVLPTHTATTTTVIPVVDHAACIEANAALSRTNSSRGTKRPASSMPTNFLDLMENAFASSNHNQQSVDADELLTVRPSTSKGLQSSSPKPATAKGAAKVIPVGRGNVKMMCTKVNLHQLLKDTHTGRSLLKIYDKMGFLETSQRNDLVRLIIEEVMQQGDTLCPKDFCAIVDDIITVFPNEKAAADYYFIYRTGRCNPLGRLYQRYTNENVKRRRTIRLAEESDLSDGERKSSLSYDDETVSSFTHNLPGTVPQVDEMTALALKQLLTTDHFSWDEICDKWIQTWALRQKELQHLGLTELMQNWPKLMDPRAGELYKIDFKHVHIDKENLLFSKWDEFVRRITPQYNDKRLSNEELKKLYKYTKMNSATKDEKDFVYTICLANLLPPYGRFKDQSGKLKLRASISDSIESFVMRLSSLEAFEAELDMYKRKYGPINPTTHPFLVVIQPTDYTISKVYVALESYFYRVQSFLHGLDLCFKIYHTCSLKYPTICENIWTFIQRYFYEMSVSWEARNANLASLVFSLNHS